MLTSSYDQANEIKYPVGNERDIDLVIEHVMQHVTPNKLLWLQPLSQSKKATDLCIAAATKLDVRVSIIMIDSNFSATTAFVWSVGVCIGSDQACSFEKVRSSQSIN